MASWFWYLYPVSLRQKERARSWLLLVWREKSERERKGKKKWKKREGKRSDRRNIHVYFFFLGKMYFIYTRIRIANETLYSLHNILLRLIHTNELTKRSYEKHCKRKPELLYTHNRTILNCYFFFLCARKEKKGKQSCVSSCNIKFLFFSFFFLDILSVRLLVALDLRQIIK